MPRRTGGFIGHRGLQAPDPPTIGTASAGNARVSVAFTAPSDVGDDAITGFVAQVGGAGATGSSSPIVVSGVSNGSEVTAQVRAINDYGTSAPSADSSGVTPSSSGTGVAAGGLSGYATHIDHIVIASLGNALEFGDLSVGRANGPAAAGNASRVLFAGGYGPSDNSDVIDFGTYAGGTFTDFGNLTNARNGTAGCNNNTRAVFAMGSTADQNVIDYVTIASEGNTTDFGDLTVGRENGRGLASTTRGVFIGGNSNVIDYVTIGSTGNATDFGDLLSAATTAGGACSNATRGLHAGGRRSSAQIDVIQYITIDSAGNASDFGDLASATRYMDGAASSSRAVFMGAQSANTIQYVTIASTGNATDFGDMSNNLSTSNAATSNSHGGLS